MEPKNQQTFGHCPGSDIACAHHTNILSKSAPILVYTKLHIWPEWFDGSRTQSTALGNLVSLDMVWVGQIYSRMVREVGPLDVGSGTSWPLTNSKL